MTPKKEVAEVLAESVVATFAEMAFVDIAEVPETAEPLEYSHILAVDFIEPGAGSLALYLPYECKRQIVENIYGSDWKALSSTEIDDCLLEILNVLAGTFLNNYYGVERRISMSFPELLFDDHRIRNLANRKEFCFDAEGNQFRIALIL